VSDSRGAIRPGVILALVCGVQFMVILDLAVVNVAIPSIQADLGLVQADLQWVVVTYAVTLGGFLLLGGRAADLFGRRRVLVGGLVLFAAASLGAGLAGSLAQLIACRAVQGLGAAMAAPVALSILVGTFAEEAVAGLAGGMVETAREVGGAFGTAVVATIAIARTNDLLDAGSPGGAALTEGFQRGSLVVVVHGETVPFEYLCLTIDPRDPDLFGWTRVMVP
jgi:MFS family permease